MTVEENRLENASYALFEQLVLQRDRLLREAGSLQTAYTKQFGELLTEVFREKIACIRQKKAIAYCQAAVNRGQAADLQAMQLFLDREMAAYRHTLHEMLRDNQTAREAVQCNIVDLERAKKLYRRLARKIHPDIHPQTAQSPELLRLWNSITAAYHRCDARRLEELEAAVNHILAEEGIDITPQDIPDIDDKIERLQQEIADILSTEPYTYEALLSDDDAVQRKKDELQHELDELRAYHAQLDEYLKKLIAGGGLQFQWKTD